MPPISPAGVPADRESRRTAVGNGGWRRWLPTVTSSGRPGRPIVERVVDRARCSTGASCAICVFGRAFGAASASGAGERVSRNEQVVGSIPTGGSKKSQVRDQVTANKASTRLAGEPGRGAKWGRRRVRARLMLDSWFRLLGDSLRTRFR